MNNAFERIKQVLIKDKTKMPDNFNTLLKRDVSQAMSAYMDMLDDSFQLNFELDDDGFYDVTIKAKAERIIPPKFYAE